MRQVVNRCERASAFSRIYKALSQECEQHVAAVRLLTVTVRTLKLTARILMALDEVSGTGYAWRDCGLTKPDSWLAIK